LVTITSGATSVVVHRLDRSHDRPVRNVLHEILGRTDPDVVRRPAATRAGQLQLMLPSYGDEVALEQLHADAWSLQLVDDEHPAANMQYVVSGDMAVSLDPASGVRGLLTVPFREVLA